METERCPIVSVHLNYVDRTARREIVVQTGEHTVRVDLIGSVFETDGVQEKVDVDRDATYRAQHAAILTGNSDGLCGPAEALETLITIEAAERASSTHAWLQR
jgi:hypothetical protein